MGKKKRLKLERAQQAALAQKAEKLPLSKGVIVFGILLIFTSLEHMLKLSAQKPLYFDAYKYMPEWFVEVRYAFSWFLRFAGLTAGIGLLARQEFARKLAFAIGAFTVLTVYWKHPVHAVQLHTQYLDKQIGYLLSMTGTGVTFTSVAPIAAVVLMINDIIFWGIFFFFFTRPLVKGQFKPSA
ncbi:MAG TPA: hypothetical protein PKV84_06565 [Candidatus Omnitrophota bacterium]|nr:hypothetical protein [Candidatus Omnitrophota bacterium]